MGTRGVVGFRIAGQDKLAYNHFDSYPEGLGQDVVKFLKNALVSEPAGLELLALSVASLEVVDPKVPPTAEQIAQLAPWTDLTVSEKSTKDWYCLLRGAQGDLAAMLAAGYLLKGAEQFILDSLYCEWGYIINLDDGVLEVYKGFQREEHDQGRYAKDRTLLDDPEHYKYGAYYPCALIATFAFDALPENLARALPKDEEDEE